MNILSLFISLVAVINLTVLPVAQAKQMLTGEHYVNRSIKTYKDSKNLGDYVQQTKESIPANYHEFLTKKIKI